MNLWIITVNFGDTKPTESLIDSVIKFDNINSIKIGIADNGASSKSSSQLKKILNQTKLDIKIFSYKKNLYYWPAAKKVLNNLKKSVGSYPDWVIICNNDIIFSDCNFLCQLEKIDTNKYPIVGPNIINSHGETLNPFMILPLSKIKKLYWNLYFFSYLSSRLLLGLRKLINFFSLKLKSKNEDMVKGVYAIHGSAVLFSNYFFEAGGSLDDKFEMYGEELTLAETAKQLRLPITFFPHLNLTHDEHKSTDKMNQRDLFFKAKSSYNYFQSKYK